MTATLSSERTARTTSSLPAAARRGRWIEHWEPEDPTFWEATGRRVARRNLILSVLAENLGFSIWVLWTVVVVNLANAGIRLSLSDQFLLSATPNLIGSFLRIPYTFAIPRFGGRGWTTFSAALLLLPCLLVAVVVPSGWLARAGHDTQLWVLLACAASAGVGGGNFSSSMANISFFYPEGRKGFPLGVNAAGGNLGVAVCQLLVPLALIVGVPTAVARLPHHPVHLAYAGILWMPFVVAVAICAWLRMDSLAPARSDGRSYALAAGNPQTWMISLLYIGTFGSFIGYSFALPLVIKNTFPVWLSHHGFIATYLAGLSFVGALIGSLTRPVGGLLADRFGGGRISLFCFAAMAAGTAAAIHGVETRSFGVFLGAYAFVFAFSGAGNGSVYQLIPTAFARHAHRACLDPLQGKRAAAAAIGIAGAVGAFGGFLIQLAFRQASLPVAHALTNAASPSQKEAIAAAHSSWTVPALWVFLVAYVLLGGITWAAYVRKRCAHRVEADQAIPTNYGQG